MECSHSGWTAAGVMNVYTALAGIVLLLHLFWCAWVLFGWMVTRGHPELRWFHIGSLCYAIIIELVPWPPCPLTALENWLDARAGIAQAHSRFLVRLLDEIIYPNLPEWLVVAGTVTVCVAILGVYARRYRRQIG